MDVALLQRAEFDPNCVETLWDSVAAIERKGGLLLFFVLNLSV